MNESKFSSPAPFYFMGNRAKAPGMAPERARTHAL